MGKAELKIEIDDHLLAQARAAEVGLALVVERALRAELGPAAAEARARRWAEDNSQAIASYNQFVEDGGAFGEEWRGW
jgi:antitoxin CcdA